MITEKKKKELNNSMGTVEVKESLMQALNECGIDVRSYDELHYCLAMVVKTLGFLKRINR